MLTVSFCFRMGNTVTTIIDVATLIDVMNHHSNLRSDDSKEWAKNMRDYITERQRAVAFNRGLDARPDVTVIILSLLCVILTVVSLYPQKQHRALESRLQHLESLNINDSTFVKHRLLGMQIDDLRKGDHAARDASYCVKNRFSQ